jgi:hypothetical protein
MATVFQQNSTLKPSGNMIQYIHEKNHSNFSKNMFDILNGSTLPLTGKIIWQVKSSAFELASINKLQSKQLLPFCQHLLLKYV